MITNDLVDFMNSKTQEMEDEYIRIQKRATDDPGTAGDQGEENWAKIFKDWLPPTFQIVTKGRILNYNGETSPQVDVIILQPEYPKNLLDKKLYLAGGVIAAFECKLTIKSHHIDKFLKNSSIIKKFGEERKGSPFKELQRPIIYGLLAHSHSWKGEHSKPIENIGTKIIQSDLKYITHPSQMPDVVCVSDLATWSALKMTYFGPNQFKDWTQMESIYGKNGSASSTYVCHSKEVEKQSINFTPIGALLTSLLNKMAWEYINLRPLARYFELVHIEGGGEGQSRKWDSQIYSDEIRFKVELGKLSNGVLWDEWSICLR